MPHIFFSSPREDILARAATPPLPAPFRGLFSDPPPLRRNVTSTESIINPDAPLALRLSGQLMLGVVRVYSRKVNYLFQDCSEALVKIKQAFTRDKDVDLPEGAETAPLNTITLPENYDDLELFFEPGGGAGGNAASDAAAAAAEDITLEESDAFGGSAFEEQYAYDDRIHGDVDDDFIVDEMDPGFHPTPGYRTPGAPPRPFGETDAGDVADVRLEDYDEAPQRSDSGDGFGGDGFGGDAETPLGDGDGDDDDIAPLPLDDDLEDENGVRGTVVGFKTPPAGEKGSGKKIVADGKENAPHTGSTVVLEWGKTAQKAARPEPAKRARSRSRQTTMKLKFDGATILDRDAVSRAIRDASDITKTRVPGVIRRMADLADDDRPFGADEERDEAGHATLGYYRDAHGVAPPPETPAEARAAVRGALGGRDPLMGHRASRRWLAARAGCVRALWARAGERRGAGFARDPRHARGRRRGSVHGSVAGDAEDVARVVDFDAGFDDDGDFGGGFDDDDEGRGDLGDPTDEHMDAFTPGSGRRLGAARAASDALGSEPPTPAGAPSGHVDWSAATKRMLADVAPVLENGGATTVSEMTSRRDENNAKVKVSRSEAARIFYQVLVLKTHGFVDLEQKRAYGDIDVVAGPKMVEAA